MTTPDIIDAHLHLWDLFTAERARAELDAAGIAAAILVQGEDSERDTRFLLDAADRHRWIAGVVGWVPLDDPARAERQLDQRHPALRGVRHLVHDDPRDEFLALPEVRTSLAMLAERGIPFDVPDAWPRHLAATAELAAALPSLTIVVDHLAKPPRGRGDYDEWRSALGVVAQRPNTVAKVSGLQFPGAPFTVEAIRPVWEIALELFRPSRLMYGGDWPMTVPTGGYGPTWQVMSKLIGELTPGEQRKVLSGTATAVYGRD